MSGDDVDPHDDLERVRELGELLGMPGPLRPEDDGIELESGRDFVARMIARDAVSAKRRTRRTATRAAVVVTVAATAVGVLVVAPWQNQPAEAGTPPVLNYELARATDIAFAPGEDATVALERAATAARQAPPSTPASGKGRVEYVRTDSWFAHRDDRGDGADRQASTIVPTTVQTWTSPDGSQTVVETAGAPLRTDGRGLSVVLPSTSGRKQQEFGPGNGTYAAASTLGATPAAVLAALSARGGCDPSSSDTVRAQCLYQQVSILFSQNVVPTSTAALIWSALSTQPGFRSLGTVTDRAGRTGTGISVISDDAPQYRSVLIVSEATGRLLGTEEILIRSDPALGLRAPAVNAFTALVDSRRVEKVGGNVS